MTTILAIDLETSGYVPYHKGGHASLLELAWTLWVDGHEVACATQVIRPDHAITWSDGARELAHASGLLAALAHGTDTWDAVQDLHGVARRADLLVAHYAHFERTWLPHLDSHRPGTWVCTRGLYWALYPDAPSRSLTPACRAMGVVPPTPAHRALPDARACAALWWALYTEGQRRGMAHEALVALAAPVEHR